MRTKETLARVASSSKPKPPPVIRVTPKKSKKGDIESLIAAVSASGDSSPDIDRTPRRLQPYADLPLGQVRKTVHKVQTSKKKSRPKIRTYYVNREGRITRTELN